MFAAISASLALLATAQVVVSSPAIYNRTAEPELELLRRQNLANVYSSCTEVSRCYS